ncbi:D-alanine--D-alanine ligase family protein [Alkaliphilus crotonatoxidans]
MKTNIYVVYGGKSVEHEVSLKTAFSIINALDKDKYDVYPVYITNEGQWCCLGQQKEPLINILHLQKPSANHISQSIGKFLTEHYNPEERNLIFPAVHGTNGEDGTLQGFLELLEVPYVGNGVMASAIGFDKEIIKELFEKWQIPQAKYTTLSYKNWRINPALSCSEIEALIGYPCYVKPARLGSSVGINRCENRVALEAALEEAMKYDDKVVVEEEIRGREMQIAVVGNDTPKSSVVGEYIQAKAYMDYNAKYVDGQLIPVIPAALISEVSEKMRKTAEDIFQRLDCKGLLRVDYFVTEDNQFYVNEVNTIPGFTSFSMFPALWEQTDGTTYSQLIEKLIDLAFERYEQGKRIQKKRWIK